MKLKNMISIFILLSVGFVLTAAPLFGEPVLQDPCDQKHLPASIQEILQKKFSSWKMLTLKELSNEDQGFWARSEKRKECPGIAYGYYEVKTALSFVLSLVPQNGKLRGYRLVIFSPEEKNRYREDILEKLDGPSNPLVVYTVPPGRYWNDDRSKSVQIQMDGFQSEEKEKGAFLYYWEGGSLNRWTVSE
jgi:hypothetical protein